MTIAVRFHDWQAPGGQPTGLRTCSPALGELRRDIQARWPLTFLGCYGVRPIRGGTAPSTHAFGAALDISYRQNGSVRDQLIGYSVAWSEEWGLQAVHDYQGGRIWRAGRTKDPSEACTTWWRAQRRDQFGMGQPWADWLHLELHPDRWSDAQTAAERGIL